MIRDIFESQQPNDELESKRVHEANVWATFYMTFNDDNPDNMISAFNNAQLDTADDIHNANINWAGELLSRHEDRKEIISLFPESEAYLNQFDKKQADANGIKWLRTLYEDPCSRLTAQYIRSQADYQVRVRHRPSTDLDDYQDRQHYQ